MVNNLLILAITIIVIALSVLIAFWLAKRSTKKIKNELTDALKTDPYVIPKQEIKEVKKDVIEKDKEILKAAIRGEFDREIEKELGYARDGGEVSEGMGGEPIAETASPDIRTEREAGEPTDISLQSSGEAEGNRRRVKLRRRRTFQAD